MTKTKITHRQAISDESQLPNDLHPLLRRLYSHRGVESESELANTLNQLAPFTTLSNIEEAVSCLYKHLKAQNHMMIVGDFDADGATSTAIVIRALKSMGAKNLNFMVPDRFKYGYGLTPGIVEEAAKLSPDLIITVDNGISSFDGIQLAKEKGIEVLVTDHHLPADRLPDADVIINPNLPGDKFPSKNLAGVGVAFYLMLALRAKLREENWFLFQDIKEPNLANLLDIVALGTVADVVPLDTNNRILVHQGLARMKAGKCCAGIKALLQVAGRDYQQITASDLGFVVGPRLNAAGRLEDMSKGIQCLLTDNAFRAREIATELQALNQSRRQIEEDMQAEALSLLEDLSFEGELPMGIAVFQPSWHQGVVGLLASRLKEKYHRPVIAFAPGENGEIKGSGRSIPSINIRDLLEGIDTQNPGLIIKFGGHAMAAGLSISADKFEAFQQAFNDAVKSQVDEETFQGEILSDGQLSEEEFVIDLAELLKNSGPWGQGFPEPVFDGDFHCVKHQWLKEKHLKLWLAHPNKQETIEAIAFNVSDKPLPDSLRQLTLAYKLDVNTFRGEKKLQLLVEHIE